MSIVMLEEAATALSPFLDQVTFVGGATVALWITDEASPGPRVTKDVDVVVPEVTSRIAWHKLEERLRAHGLRNDTSSSVICRWIAGDSETPMLVDIMPGDPAILGFSNSWQAPACETAPLISLPSGVQIRVATPPYLLAMKLEAWNGRGEGDHLRSHDLEDVVALVDGRNEILAEVEASPSDVRSFIAREIADLLRQSRFRDLIDGTVIGYGSGDEDRVDGLVVPRMRSLAQARP